MVHDPSKAMDISADLQELTRCPVGLVSAGVKSILDIGRSGVLTDAHVWENVIVEEYAFQDIRISRTSHVRTVVPLSPNVTQETLGIPVVTYGETQDFPAFYSPSSGFKVGVYFILAAFMVHLDSLGFRVHGELMILLPLQTFFVCDI